MLDNNGYYILRRKPGVSLSSGLVGGSGYLNDGDRKKSSKADDDEITKAKRPKDFKKGSWKWLAWKILKRTKLLYKHFNDPHVEDLLVTFPKKKSSEGRVLKSTAFTGNDVIQCPKDGWFLLKNGPTNTYTRVSKKSYEKLRDLVKIHVRYVLESTMDDGTKTELFRKESVITDVNSLMWFIEYHRRRDAWIEEIMNESGGFVTYHHDVRMVVIDRFGKVKTFKGDMNDFMKHYGLEPF